MMASPAPVAPPRNPNTSFANSPHPRLLIPTMSEIIESSKAQGLRLRLRALGPFFRVRALRWTAEDNGLRPELELELGRAEGVIRPWLGAKILHLDSMRMSRETLHMDRSIFGLGLFLGAAAVRFGFDRGCKRAELLAINDSPLYHSKLVRFYTRMGFKAAHEVEGSSMGDLAHMLAWGGRGTRMEADVQQLLVKWGRRLKPPRSSPD